MKLIKVAVIGSGNIGIDLCERLLRDERFVIVALIGRRPDSEGLRRFNGKIPNLLSNSHMSLTEIIQSVDGIFDATSAFDHKKHWDIAKSAGKWAVDLTPSKIGLPMSPVLADLVDKMNFNNENSTNYSMVTCGGQSSAPLVYSIKKGVSKVIDVEVSSSIASKSAGPATRLNVDNYIETTKSLAKDIAMCENAKAILVLNPAEPPVMMRTTVQAKCTGIQVDVIRDTLRDMVLRIQRFLPGYRVTVEPFVANDDVVSITALVEGAGFYLPKYAGNLDIINAAALETAYLHQLAQGN